MVVFGSMIAYVLDRRKSKLNPLVNTLVLAGLIIPPAVVPTIWVMQSLGIFKTLPGLIMVEVAFGLAFTVITMRAFIASIPREIDEAAIVDGAGPLRLFFQVVFPLLRSVIVTVIVVQSIFVFNDFQNPLYFLPGSQNATVQLTLFNYISQSQNSFNLLFANILVITIPMLIMYIVFNRQIVAGMTSGAVKG
jgi:raffinose/stachyose/melibiose transport system permease protein